MKYEIEASAAPILNLRLTDGESIYTTDSSAAWLSNNFEIKTGARGALTSRLSGDSVTATTYKCTKGIGTLTFTSGLAGQILDHALKPTSSVIVPQGNMIAAEESVKISNTRGKQLEGQLYGGRGFNVQRFSGPGMLFVRVLGVLVTQDLETGAELWVEPAHVVMFDASLGVDVQPARSASNLAVGPDERQHFLMLKGPGRVWLQTSSRAAVLGLVAGR